MPIIKFDLKVDNLSELTHFQIDFYGAYILVHSCLLAEVQPASTLCDWSKSCSLGAMSHKGSALLFPQK